MKTETFKGKIDTYQNKPISYWTEVLGDKLKDWSNEYSGTAELFSSPQEAKEAGDWMGDSDIFKAVNNARLTAAKASKYQEQTAVLKEAYEKSDDFKRAGLVKAAVAAGFSQQEAEALAASKLG